MEEIGPRVTKGWKKGDRIATFVHGGNDTHPDDGIKHCSVVVGVCHTDVKCRCFRGVLSGERRPRYEG